jgi:aryl-alcohol dehydrogenase-like predicted oxidoreductase
MVARTKTVLGRPRAGGGNAALHHIEHRQRDGGNWEQVAPASFLAHHREEVYLSLHPLRPTAQVGYSTIPGSRAMSRNRADHDPSSIKRRDFVKSSGAALAGAVMVVPAPTAESDTPAMLPDVAPLFPVQPSREGRIQSYRTLGRTGFRVSDISLGASFLREANLVRYAVDKGINYIDTAESYANGTAERAIRDALQHINREEIFISTKSNVRQSDDKEAVLTRARRSLERLNTEYIDAYMMSSVDTVEWLNAPGYHAAMDQLKSEGRVRFSGVTYHGPEATDQTGMANILCAAAEDGRFDVLLLVYNFLNRSEGDRILAAAKANNVGTTAMKTAPGKLKAEPFDPDNLTEVYQQYLGAMLRAGVTREAALRELRAYSDAQNQFVERTQRFAEQHGIENERALQLASIQWVLQNPDMHTACISAWSFDFIDKIVALSGTRPTAPADELLHESRSTLSTQYCRHGCVSCSDSCPFDVPVSNIMRYAYYFEAQGQERYAMSAYAALDGPGAAPCKDCTGLCAGACRYGLAIQPMMLQAHNLLTLAQS